MANSLIGLSARELCDLAEEQIKLTTRSLRKTERAVKMMQTALDQVDWNLYVCSKVIDSELIQPMADA